MASKRWFADQVLQLVQRYASRTDKEDLKPDASVEDRLAQFDAKVEFSGDEPNTLRATIVHKDEEPALSNIEETARALQLRLSRTEDGDVVSPR